MTVADMIETEKCGKCDKTVYEAEGFPADGRRFHKKCFKCTTCSRKLDSTSVRVHAGQLYCKVCQKKASPDESPKIYADTTVIMPKDDKGCPRCGGAVYEAEKVPIKDEVYHKRCFNCHRCARPLDTLGAHVGPEMNVFCKVCFKVVTAPERPQYQTDTTIIMAEEEKEGCPRCSGKVFEAEKMTAKTGLYHKRCFTCAECRRALDYQLCTEGPDGELYCKLCYSYKHGHKAKPNLHTADVTALPGEEGSPDVCPRCTGFVFEAEKQVTKHGSYHKKCFTCCKCKHQLGPSDFINGPEPDVYCIHCYRITHGHKAPTRSMPLDTTSILGDQGDKRKCPRCSGKVFEAEKMVAASGWYHRHCFRCSFCAQPVDSTSVCDGPDNKIYCRVCYGRMRASSKPATVDTWVIKAEKDAPDCCPKCDGHVYQAEKMITASGTWYHKSCFRCVECERLLDSLTANDGMDGRLYCKQCYIKKYGPHTRSSDIDHKLIDTSIIKNEDDAKNCPRCGGAVFKAEEIRSRKKSYHKKCASCAACAKQLDHNGVYDGTDGDIYCKNCYARKFAPAGYRGTGCADWVDTDSNSALRHSYQAF